MLNKTVITGRVQSWLDGARSLPVSCTITDFDPEGKFIDYVLASLKFGAGNNIHLDGLDSFQPAKPGKLVFQLSRSHPEWSEMWEEPTEDAIKVQDSIRGVNSISAMCIAAFQGKDLKMDFSNVRAIGTESLNFKGMVASGVVSFRNLVTACQINPDVPLIQSILTLLSTCNQEMRRGGAIKNGAVTSSYPIYGKYIREYIGANPHAFNWLKRSVVMTSDWEDFDLTEELLDGVNDGTIWLEKRLSMDYHLVGGIAKRYWLSSRDILEMAYLQHNVCREILIKKGETCNLFHVNLGQIEEPGELEEVMPWLVEFGIDIHKRNAQGELDIYKPAHEDQQIGVGLVGMANLLRNHGVKYSQFSQAFSRVTSDSMLAGVTSWATGMVSDKLGISKEDLFSRLPKPRTMAELLANSLFRGYINGSEVAHRHGYKRVWCIAPTANSSYKYRDFQGWSLTPQIVPPITQLVERVSASEETIRAEYGPRIEVAAEVGYEVYFALVEGLQKLFDATLLGHSISFDIIKEWGYGDLKNWAESQVTATYYRTLTDTAHLDKSNQFGIQCSGCVE